ncbi:CbtA family protein [Actinomadura sp. CNU-125]|uniref:CbtA family protein n=1 Tax=Actinomadura sp. CNU-125 TaxID=1904961 RepID=UPI0021CCBC4E|nr:CbtA family protein [Actinomadura sp. CNU-125]
MYFGTAALGVLATAAAVIVGRRLVPRLGAWNAAVATAAGFVVPIAAANRLTPDPDALPDGFPATVLWDFRIASLGIQLALWTTLGVVFGLLAERALTRRTPPVRA